MGIIKFTCFDIQATVQETDRDPESFHMLQAVWVKAEGIPKIAKKEIHVMELAYLVGDPEEVFLESLEWKEVWVKVSCKDPKKIAGTSEVYINKQGHKISWSVADKGPTKSQKPAAKSKDNDDDATNEDEPESQDSYGLDNDWLKSGTPPAQGGSEAAKKTDSTHQEEMGKKHQHSDQVLSREMSVEVVDALKHVDTGKETGSLDTSADNTKQVEESAVGANSEVVMLAVEEGCGKGRQDNHHPPRASRWSQRTHRIGASAAALPELRKAKQNLPNAGKNSTNAYIAFHDYDNRILDSTARNCGIKLGLDTSDADRKISLLKAKELAQAAISKAADLLKQKVDNEAIPVNNPENDVEVGQDKIKDLLCQDKEVELSRDAKSCEITGAIPSSGERCARPKSDQ